MEFFSLFYQLNVYGQDLFYHLKGWDNGMQDFVAANNQFPTIWLVTFFSALLVFVVYYYILNHPRFNKVWHWLITMAVLAIGIFIWSRGLVMSDIAGVSLHPVDPALNVSADNALMFGVYNAVLLPSSSSYSPSWVGLEARTARILLGNHSLTGSSHGKVICIWYRRYRFKNPPRPHNDAGQRC